MQVHREHAVDARRLEHAGHEARGDRLARGRLLVLARVAVPRRDGDHAVRRRADRRVDHDQQLHQRVVGGDPRVRVAARGLHDEHVGAADRLLVAAVDLAVGERLERDRAEVDVELAGRSSPPARVGPPREQHQPLVVADLQPRPRLRGGGGLELLEQAHEDSESTGRLRRRSAYSSTLRLALARHAQRPGRDVVGDHDRAGRRPGAVADLDRRDEGGVDAAADVGADRRAVLGEAVVVGGDGARAEVGALPHVGVADVGQVRNLGPRADVRVLDLDERAGLRALPQQRRRAAGRRTARRCRRRDLAAVEVGVADRHIVAEHGVDQRRGRADAAALAGARRAAHVGAGSITVSAPISTSTSMSVDAGSTIVTPARM